MSELILPYDRERDVMTSRGRIIVTEEGCVFGGSMPTNLDPVDALVDALDEIVELRQQLSVDGGDSADDEIADIQSRLDTCTRCGATILHDVDGGDGE